MPKKFYDAQPELLFTRCHTLDYLDKNERATVVELAKQFGQHDFKVHRQLQRLINDGLVKRVQEKVKNHWTWYYYLTPYAQQYKMKNGLRSFMERTNPMFERIKKVAERHSESKRQKAGKETVIVPKKELIGFR